MVHLQSCGAVNGLRYSYCVVVQLMCFGTVSVLRYCVVVQLLCCGAVNGLWHFVEVQLLFVGQELCCGSATV